MFEHPLSNAFDYMYVRTCGSQICDKLRDTIRNTELNSFQISYEKKFKWK